MNKERIVFIDWLRVVAIVAVIVLHVADDYPSTIDPNCIEYQTLNFFNGIVRWGVPVFVMISGSLFLSMNYDMGGVKKLYNKNIKRLAIGYMIWSTFYTLIYYIAGHLGHLRGQEISFSIANMVSKLLVGEYHMWFIPMIIGLYILTPIIKSIVTRIDVAKYFLIVLFIFSFVLPQTINIIIDIAPEELSNVMNSFNTLIGNMNICMLSTYSFYFVLGYYITNHCAKRENIRLVYALGFVGFTVTVLLNGYMAAKYNIFGKYYNNSTINVAFEAIFIFVLFKNLRLNYNRMNDFMIKLSKYSFGAYWVHVFILKSLHIIGIHSLAMNPLFAVPVVAILVIALSFSISYALNKIPHLNKWIV